MLFRGYAVTIIDFNFLLKKKSPVTLPDFFLCYTILFYQTLIILYNIRDCLSLAPGGYDTGNSIELRIYVDFAHPSKEPLWSIHQTAFFALLKDFQGFRSIRKPLSSASTLMMTIFYILIVKMACTYFNIKQLLSKCFVI